jgi:transposase-like protein
VSHRNARLTFHGRLLLVERVCQQRRPVAHVAKELGVSRQCAHRWVARYRSEGEAGLADRSSCPHHHPRRTPAAVEARVIQARRAHRRGQDWLGPELAVPARTVARILRRHQMPYLRECDPLTGQIIRASKATAVRYERDRPGELVHMDVKKTRAYQRRRRVEGPRPRTRAELGAEETPDRVRLRPFPRR